MTERNNGRGAFCPGEIYDLVIDQSVSLESGSHGRQKPAKKIENLDRSFAPSPWECCLGTDHVGWAARANVCSTPRTVTKRGVGEVRGKEEEEGHKEHGLAYVQHRAYSS
jgi:hypothetical protein